MTRFVVRSNASVARFMLTSVQVVLETEASNAAAQALYSRLGFMKEKRLQRYYLNGGDAFRLKARLKGPMYPQ